MKTIISSILIMAGIIFLHSCRQENEELGVDTQVQYSKSTDADVHRDSDTINTAAYPGTFNTSEDPDDGTTLTDPPPKDGDQWRIKE
jgi:hypothetical protein